MAVFRELPGKKYFARNNLSLNLMFNQRIARNNFMFNQRIARKHSLNNQRIAVWHSDFFFFFLQ